MRFCSFQHVDGWMDKNEWCSFTHSNGIKQEAGRTGIFRTFVRCDGKGALQFLACTERENDYNGGNRPISRWEIKRKHWVLERPALEREREGEGGSQQMHDVYTVFSWRHKKPPRYILAKNWPETRKTKLAFLGTSLLRRESSFSLPLAPSSCNRPAELPWRIS